MNEEKECIVIIDNSNVWIEGMKLSALKEGIKSSPIEEKEPCDYSWRLSFGNLLNKVSEGKKVVSTLLVGSRPPKKIVCGLPQRNRAFKLVFLIEILKEKKKPWMHKSLLKGQK